MKERFEVILAGSGGQGLVVSGKLLGEAAIQEGKNVVQTQSYGTAQRGGLSLSEVIIDSSEIIFQQVQQPDAILALSESAIKKYAAASGGVPVIYDRNILDAGEGDGLFGLPLSDLADKCGSAANMVGLGALVAIAGVVSFDSLAETISRSFPEARAKNNIDAVRIGIQAAQAEKK